MNISHKWGFFMEYVMSDNEWTKMKLESHLSLRDSANDLFDRIDITVTTPDILLDFSGVLTISRSFAHQFIVRMEQSCKKIICINQSDDIRHMFELVKAKGNKPDVVSKTKLTPINLSAIAN